MEQPRHAFLGETSAPVIDLFSARPKTMHKRQADRLIGVVFTTIVWSTEPIVSFVIAIEGEGLLPRPWLDSLDIVIEDGERYMAKLGPAYEGKPPQNGRRLVILATNPIPGMPQPAPDARFAIECANRVLWRGIWGKLYHSPRDHNELKREFLG